MPQALFGDELQDVSLTFDGSIMVAGFFSEQATFGRKKLTAAGFTDVFIAKYTAGRSKQQPFDSLTACFCAAGDQLWVEQAGGKVKIIRFSLSILAL